jgi:hypothetical protein
MILRWTLVFVLVLGHGLFANPKCLAEPGLGIKQLVRTRASALDLFMQTFSAYSNRYHTYYAPA